MAVEDYTVDVLDTTDPDQMVLALEGYRVKCRDRRERHWDYLLIDTIHQRGWYHLRMSDIIIDFKRGWQETKWWDLKPG